MSDVQLANVMKAVRRRSDASISQGGTGYVSTDVLRFDVGLNTRTLRRVLDEAVASGAMLRCAAGRGYGYRPVMVNA